MAKILVKNGLIVTMDSKKRIINGSILVEGNEIKKVGNIENEDADKIIDAEGKIVMPGLICAFTHTSSILLRAAPLKIEPPTEFTQFLQRVWWPFDEELSNKDSHIGTLSTCTELIKNGITFFACSHSSQESIGKSLDYVASAIEESGLRALISYEASERHTVAEGARGMKENIRFLKNRQKKRPNETRVKGMVSLGPSFTSSDELLRHGKRVAEQFNSPLLISTAEGPVDLYHNLEVHGKRTIERFRDIGLLSSNTVLAHCLHINDEELSLIKKAGSKIVHNPTSNLLKGTGLAPIIKMKKLGIPIGLGNGSPLSNGFENIRSFYLIHKTKTGDLRTISPIEALETATIRGAEIYGLENKIGSIEPGKRADIIIVNAPDLPTPLRRDNVTNHLVSSTCGNNVETVMVGGDLLMENRNIKTLDEERTMKKSRKTAKKIWKKLNL